MRETRPHDYDPAFQTPTQEPQPEAIELPDAVPIQRNVLPVTQNSPNEQPAATASASRNPTTPRYHGSMTPWYQELVEPVRKAVKELGKEAATHRFTAAEKQALAEMIFTYRRQGIRTSENEIARIAINALVADYKRQGENSLLAQVLRELNS